jgi:hypothetical protein
LSPPAKAVTRIIAIGDINPALTTAFSGWRKNAYFLKDLSSKPISGADNDEGGHTNPHNRTGCWSHLCKSGLDENSEAD